jgi:maleate isomerase
MPVPRSWLTDGRQRRSKAPDHLTQMQRLGILTPSSNTVLEPAMMRLCAPLADRLSLHFARFRVTVISDEPDSSRQFALEPMLEAVRLLDDARVDAFLWAGTAAAWEGPATDDHLVAAIRAATGTPATTATQALLLAFRALGVRRYGLVVPYVQPIVDRIVGNLDAAGYACAAVHNDSLTTNWEFAAVSADSVAEGVREVAGAQPDAIVVHCTNMRGAEVAESLEQEIGISVLDSVVVGLWGALQLLGIPTPEAGFGALAHVGRPQVAHA